MGVSQKSEDLIMVERKDKGIAYVTINRPKSLNSLTKPMLNDLAKAFKFLNVDADVKVIIFTGVGRAFCSGVDLTDANLYSKGM